MSSPNSSEYNFQYQDIDYPVFDSLTAVVENAVDMEQISCCAKVVFKGNQVEGIGVFKLKKVDCYVADETCLLKLTLWEGYIDMVSVGEVYTFKHLRIRENDGEGNGRILNTTLHPIQTVITQAENLSEEQRCAFNYVALLEADSEDHQYMELNIDNFDSIEELSHSKQCPKCQKKIQQDNSSLITKCDHCGSTFRNSSCEIVTLVKFLVQNKQGGSDKTEKFSRFTVSKDVLEKMIGSIEGAHDDVILEKLLMLENFQLSYNNQQVVKYVTI